MKKIKDYLVFSGDGILDALKRINDNKSRIHPPACYTAIQSAVDAMTERGASTEVAQRLHQLMPTLRACLW